MTRFIFLVVCLLVAGGHLPAQPLPTGSFETAEPGPPQVDLSSRDTAEAAIARLSDREVRALLLSRLETAETEAPDSLAELEVLAADAISGFANALRLALEAAPNLPKGVGEGLGSFYAPREFAGTLHLLAVLALALGAAWAVERAFAAILPQPKRLPTVSGGVPLSAQLRFLAHRLAVEASGAAVFLGTAWAVVSLAHPPEPISYQVLYFFVKLPVLYGKLVHAATRFALVPDRPDLRLVEMDDASARRLHWGLVVFAVLVGLRAYILSFLGGHGVDLSEIRIGFWLATVNAIFLAAVIWRCRSGLVQALGVRGDTPTEAWLVRAYPVYAIALVIGFWALLQTLTGLERWHLVDNRLQLTLGLLIVAPLLDRLIRWAVMHFLPPMEGTGALAAKADADARAGYVRIGRVLGAFAVLFIITRLWDVSLPELASAGLGAQLTGRLIETFLVLGVGYIVWEAARIYINRILSGEAEAEAPDPEEPGGGEGGGVGGSRLSTVLPLVSWALQATVLVLTILIALGTLGVNITPLLAGAGIVGLAVGFGAQKLVADIVSGIFFLVDDAFRIGEYVEVDGTYGTVEKISIRSLQLRHHEGPVHTIPFGTIPKLTNYSRDWVIMKLRFTVPFDTDLNKVKKLFKRIGQDMIEDERFRDDFLQPFKSQGVLEVDDVGIVIRGKFMAKPGRQWVLRKEIYARVQQTFEEAGIHFARKEVRVKIDGDTQGLPADAAQRIAGAAAEAATDVAGPAPA
ncbi:MAG: mechanosensitive ion channel family protein [Paracoccaceae bacterium]